MDPDLEQLLRHHHDAGMEHMQLVVAKAATRAAEVQRREMRWISPPRLANLVRDGILALPEQLRVSVAVCLVEHVSDAFIVRRDPDTNAMDSIADDGFLLGVTGAQLDYSLSDLQLLLQLDPVFLGHTHLMRLSDDRLAYFDLVTTGAMQLHAAGEQRVRAVIEEVQARLASWEPGHLSRPQQRRLLELRSHVAELTGRPFAEPHVVRPEDGYGVAVIEFLGSGPWDHTINALLGHLASAESATPSSRWEATCSRLLGDLPAAEELIRSLLGLLVTAPALNFEGYGTVHRLLLASNDDFARGVVWATALLAPPWAPRMLQDTAERCLKESRGRSLRPVAVQGEKVPFACIYALVRMATPAALGVLARLRQLVDNKTVINRINRALEPVAAARGLTVDQLLEANLPDYDLDRDGILRLPIGGGSALVRLGGRSGARLVWLLADGSHGSLPDDIEASFPEEVEEAKATAAGIAEAAVAERLRIQSLLATRRTYSPKAFIRSYVEHPLSGWFGRRLLWVMTAPDGERRTGRPVQSADGVLEALDGRHVALLPGSVVRLWHPVLADEAEVRAAREFVSTRLINQPFRQAWREVYRPDDVERRTELYSNRYSAHILRFNQFYALSRTRGWTGSFLSGAWDGGASAYPQKDFPDFGVRAVWTIAQIDINLNAEVELCATDRVQFEPIGLPGEPQADPIPITEVHRIVFSETMRDLDLFVTVCTIANDLIWLDRMSGERRLTEYWERVAADGLGTTLDLRRRALVDRLASGDLSGPFELSDRALVVQGKLGTYRIDLATANVALDPPGTWLSLKSPLSRRNPEGLLEDALEVDDDEILRRITDRAELFAADDKIRNKGLLQQIRRAGQ